MNCIITCKCLLKDGLTLESESETSNSNESDGLEWNELTLYLILDLLFPTRIASSTKSKPGSMVRIGVGLNTFIYIYIYI